jgi:predicted enzyme related to lactoylglutathione lyase
MLKLVSVMIGTKRAEAMARFYEKVIGKPADMINGERTFFSWQLGASFLYVLEHSQMEGNTKEPGRVLFNFETPQVKEEFERIRTLGGSVIQEPYEVQVGWFATLADPDGNYFQLVSPFSAE